MTKQEMLNELQKIEEMEQYFRRIVPDRGILMPSFETIFNEPHFIEWREKAKYLLSLLKQETIVLETINLLNEFNSYNERKSFNELKAKINIIVDNIDSLIKKDKVCDKNMNNPKIFISHRSIDKEIADFLLDFFLTVGVPHSTIFCSSLPGNDIQEKISSEVRENLKNSILNIVILSKDYYESAYCMNEAGVIWFTDEIPCVPIALPEITDKEMVGFLNSEYKIRRLDSCDDLSFVADKVCELLNLRPPKFSVIQASISKITASYKGHIADRNIGIPKEKEVLNEIDFSNLTDDESVVLYFIAKNQVKTISIEDIQNWLLNEEIDNINAENAFDLLSNLGKSEYKDNTLSLDLKVFRQLNSLGLELLLKLEERYNDHLNPSKQRFMTAWNSGCFDECNKLFVAYLIDNKVWKLGDRWLSDMQIKDIVEWEKKNHLKSFVSNNYSVCLNKFIEANYVFPIEWTSYGNPREYSLKNSLRMFLLEEIATESEVPLKTEIKELKTKYRFFEF